MLVNHSDRPIECICVFCKDKSKLFRNIKHIGFIHINEIEVTHEKYLNKKLRFFLFASNAYVLLWKALINLDFNSYHRL